MERDEAKAIMELNGIEPDPQDSSSPEDMVRRVHFSGIPLLGVAEVVSTRPLAVEPSGTYSAEDIERERKLGRAVLPVAFGQGVFPIELAVVYNSDNE